VTCRNCCHRSGWRWTLIISLAVFSFAATVQGPPARASTPSPVETQARRAAVHEAVERCAALVESGDHRKAAPLLADLRRGLAKQAEGADDAAADTKRELPRVDALIARVALASKASEKALDIVRPYVEPRDTYNPDYADCYLVAGDALLALGKPYEALVLFDWMAGQTEGLALVGAAEGCGRALLARKEYQKAVESFRFALAYARQYCYDQKDLIRRLEGRLREAQRLADMKGEPQDTFDRADRLRTDGKFAEAMELYESIVKGYPEHSLRHPAGYLAAVCLAGQKKYEPALKRATAFIEEAPQGPWRGQALLLAGDLLLEQFFDVDAAARHFSAIVHPGLLENAKAPPDGTDREPPDPLAHLADPRPDPTWAEVLPDACERLGLCFYLCGQLDVAEKYLTEELRLRPTRKLGGYTIGSNMQYLLDMCRQKKNPVYFKEHVLAGDRRVQTLLFLASAYLEAGDAAKTLSLLERLGRTPLVQSATLAQKAYAQMETAEALRLSFRFQEALKALEKFEGEYQAAPMAPMALLDKAALLLSLDDKPAALVTYQRIYTLYPRSEEAPKALYYEGYVYYFTEHWQKAIAAFRLLRSRYPKTWEAGRVSANEILELEEKLANQAKR